MSNKTISYDFSPDTLPISAYNNNNARDYHQPLQ